MEVGTSSANQSLTRYAFFSSNLADSVAFNDSMSAKALKGRFATVEGKLPAATQQFKKQKVGPSTSGRPFT